MNQRVLFGAATIFVLCAGFGASVAQTTSEHLIASPNGMRLFLQGDKDNWCGPSLTLRLEESSTSPRAASDLSTALAKVASVFAAKCSDLSSVTVFKNDPTFQKEVVRWTMDRASNWAAKVDAAVREESKGSAPDSEGPAYQLAQKSCEDWHALRTRFSCSCFARKYAERSSQFELSFNDFLDAAMRAGSAVECLDETKVKASTNDECSKYVANFNARVDCQCVGDRLIANLRQNPKFKDINDWYAWWSEKALGDAKCKLKFVPQQALTPVPIGTDGDTGLALCVTNENLLIDRQIFKKANGISKGLPMLIGEQKAVSTAKQMFESKGVSIPGGPFDSDKLRTGLERYIRAGNPDLVPGVVLFDRNVRHRAEQNMVIGDAAITLGLQSLVKGCMVIQPDTVCPKADNQPGFEKCDPIDPFDQQLEARLKGVTPTPYAAMTAAAVKLAGVPDLGARLIRSSSQLKAINELDRDKALAEQEAKLAQSDVAEHWVGGTVTLGEYSTEKAEFELQKWNFGYGDDRSVMLPNSGKLLLTPETEPVRIAASKDVARRVIEIAGSDGRRFDVLARIKPVSAKPTSKYGEEGFELTATLEEMFLFKQMGAKKRRFVAALSEPAVWAKPLKVEQASGDTSSPSAPSPDPAPKGPNVPSSRFDVIGIKLGMATKDALDIVKRELPDAKVVRMGEAMYSSGSIAPSSCEVARLRAKQMADNQVAALTFEHTPAAEELEAIRQKADAAYNVTSECKAPLVLDQAREDYEITSVHPGGITDVIQLWSNTSAGGGGHDRCYLPGHGRRLVGADHA